MWCEVDDMEVDSTDRIYRSPQGTNILFWGSRVKGVLQLPCTQASGIITGAPGSARIDGSSILTGFSKSQSIPIHEQDQIESGVAERGGGEAPKHQPQCLVLHSRSSNSSHQQPSPTKSLTFSLVRNAPRPCQAAEAMPGNAETKGSKTPTRAHTIAEFDAWRSRQELASKSRSSRAQGGVAAPAGTAAGGGGGAPYHHRRRTSAGGSGGAAAAKMPLLPLTKV